MTDRDRRAYSQFEKLLTENDITAYRVAKATGISKSTFTAWKKGEYNVKLSTLEKIADFFKVPITYFL